MRSVPAIATVCFPLAQQGVVMPAARIPEVAQERGNIQRVEVNAPVECSMLGRAGELLPALLQQVFPTS